MDGDARRLIWESLLAADYRARYFGHLAARMESFDENLTIAIAATSSGAFVSVISKLPWQVGAVISLVAAVISILLTVKKFGKLAENAAALYRGWISIQNDYEVLWCRVVDNLDLEDLLAKWRKTKAREEALEDSIGMKFNIDEGLAQKAQKEVLVSRRLALA